MNVISAAQGADYTTATYTPPRGTAVSCRVIVNERLEDGFSGAAEDLGIIVPVPDCWFLKSEIGSPATNATITIGERSWKIIKQLDDDGLMVQCQISPV